LINVADSIDNVGG